MLVKGSKLLDYTLSIYRPHGDGVCEVVNNLHFRAVNVSNAKVHADRLYRFYSSHGLVDADYGALLSPIAYDFNGTSGYQFFRKHSIMTFGTAYDA